jgi:hypothetical protein
MAYEEAERLPRPEGPERVRTALVSAVASGVSALVVQLVVGQTNRLVLLLLVAVVSALSFGIRYLVNPRPSRNPWK